MMLEAPRIKSLRPEGENVLVITWKGGAESVVDLTSFFDTYAIFSPLRLHEQHFKAVSVGEWGWCARWSEDIEVSVETLWRLSLAQGADWLRSWRKERRMTQVEASAALGVSPRMWRYYEAGVHLLPKTVRLACLGYNQQSQAA